MNENGLIPKSSSVECGATSAAKGSSKRPRVHEATSTERKAVTSRWWHKPNGQIVGYLSTDHWFYTESGEAIGRLEGHFIYTPVGDEVIGWLAQDGKWIYDEKGEPLGYLA